MPRASEIAATAMLFLQPVSLERSPPSAPISSFAASRYLPPLVLYPWGVDQDQEGWLGVSGGPRHSSANIPAPVSRGWAACPAPVQPPVQLTCCTRGQS